MLNAANVGERALRWALGAKRGDGGAGVASACGESVSPCGVCGMAPGLNERGDEGVGCLSSLVGPWLGGETP